MAVLSKFMSIILNRYVITLGVFFVWIFAFGPSDLKTQYKLSKELEKAEIEKQFYVDEIEKNRQISKDLLTNMDNLERFARESYWMKRENEDVYIVIKEKH